MPPKTPAGIVQPTTTIVIQHIQIYVNAQDAKGRLAFPTKHTRMEDFCGALCSTCQTDHGRACPQTGRFKLQQRTW